MNDIKRNKKLKIITIVTGICCLFALVFQVSVSNQAVLKGKELSELNIKKEQLEKEIALLSYENTKLSSISEIEKRALALGFVELSSPIQTASVSSLASLYAY